MKVSFSTPFHVNFPLTHLPGYFIYHQSAIPALQSTYAQLWKEYCLSDSRYLTLDVFTVCVETITVVSPPFLSITIYNVVLTVASSAGARCRASLL